MTTAPHNAARADSAITMLLATGSSFLILVGMGLAFAPGIMGTVMTGIVAA